MLRNNTFSPVFSRTHTAAAAHPCFSIRCNQVHRVMQIYAQATALYISQRDESIDWFATVHAHSVTGPREAWNARNTSPIPRVMPTGGSYILPHSGRRKLLSSRSIGGPKFTPTFFWLLQNNAHSSRAHPPPAGTQSLSSCILQKKRECHGSRIWDHWCTTGVTITYCSMSKKSDWLIKELNKTTNSFRKRTTVSEKMASLNLSLQLSRSLTNAFGLFK